MAYESGITQERARRLLRATLATPTWLPTTKEQSLVWAIRIAVSLGVLVAVVKAVDKPLWDWLQLLIVPAVIAAGAAWFNQQQRKRELEIADSRAQDEALQAYLGEMSNLLLEKKLRESGADDEVRSLARAQTLTTLRRVGGERKGSAVRFLYEIGLINKDGSIVARSAADLKGADLRGATLLEADLSGSDLRGANLSETQLYEAHLLQADLRGANLKNAYLAGADFGADVGADVGAAFGGTIGDDVGADLSGADLRGAYLEGTIFENAKLTDARLVQAYLGGAGGGHWNYAKIGQQKATYEFLQMLGASPRVPKDYNPGKYIKEPPNFSNADLSKADLTGATAGSAVLEALRKAAHIEGATMPNGQKYEDWLKDQDGGEDGENPAPS